MDTQNQTGLYVSHLMVCLPYGEQERTRVIQNISHIAADSALKNIQFIAAQTFGHESDVILMILAESCEELLGIEQQVKSTGAILVDSFVSICETSEYTTTEEQEQSRVNDLNETKEIKDKMMDDWRERIQIYNRHKLYPQLPPSNMSYICFYPMSKSRGEKNNWYCLPFEQRAEYMRAHGAVGRNYAGKITQLITGSTGLTDYEWGVTLFSKLLQDIKDIVYEMRFDQASALYGEFGHFTIGKIIDIHNL